MTAADTRTMNAAFKEKQDAGNALLVAFCKRKTKEEIDNAIRTFEQAKQNYRSFTDKFLENYPQ